MTMLQEQAVRMIQDMSDDNVGFLLEVIQRLIPKKTYTSVIYPSQKSDEKMQAFKELVATRYEAKKYLPDDFDPDAELEPNYIITRNTSDFEASVVSAIEPDEWLKKIN